MRVAAEAVVFFDTYLAEQNGPFDEKAFCVGVGVVVVVVAACVKECDV